LRSESGYGIGSPQLLQAVFTSAMNIGESEL